MTLSFATVAPSLALIAPTLATVSHVLIPDSTHPRYGNSPAYAVLPHTNEHLRKHEILTSALSSPRPGWNRRWCYHRSVPKPLCESHLSVGNTITVQSGINPRATIASIKMLFRGINVSIQPHFALACVHVLGILHGYKPYFSSTQGILPTFLLNATVKAVFMPGFTLDLFPIFSSSKCAKTSIFSGFLHS